MWCRQCFLDFQVFLYLDCFIKCVQCIILEELIIMQGRCFIFLLYKQNILDIFLKEKMNFTLKVYDVAKLYQVLVFCQLMLSFHVIILFLVQINTYKQNSVYCV